MSDELCNVVYTTSPLGGQDICALDINHKGKHDWRGERKVHTVRGKPIGPEGSPYGVTHDMDCPGCKDTPYTSSPRSETYWSS